MAFVLNASLAQATSSRVALLVGVWDYGGNGVDLRSPPIDTALMLATLEETSDFDKIIHVENPSRKALVDAIRQAAAAAKDGTIFFYYSGHAISIDGENFLIPTGASLNTIEDVALEAIGVRQIANAFRASSLRILVLDACRTNPFGLGTKAFVGGGLVRDRIEHLSGTLISYAAAAGSIAYDGVDGRPSPFTEALVRNLRLPGIALPQLFMNTRGDLAEATSHLSRGPQRSEEVNTLTSKHANFFVTPAVSGGVKSSSSVQIRRVAPVSESEPRSVILPALLISGGGIVAGLGLGIGLLGSVPLMSLALNQNIASSSDFSETERSQARAEQLIAAQFLDEWGYVTMAVGVGVVAVGLTALAVGVVPLLE